MARLVAGELEAAALAVLLFWSCWLLRSRLVNVVCTFWLRSALNLRLSALGADDPQEGSKIEGIDRRQVAVN